MVAFLPYVCYDALIFNLTASQSRSILSAQTGSGSAWSQAKDLALHHPLGDLELAMLAWNVSPAGCQATSLSDWAVAPFPFRTYSGGTLSLCHFAGALAGRTAPGHHAPKVPGSALHSGPPDWIPVCLHGLFLLWWLPQPGLHLWA